MSFTPRSFAYAQLEPDVVLVGLKSPGDDYPIVLSLLNKSGRLKHTPKIAVTDKTQRYDVVGPSISNPLWDYIAYPFEPLDLVEAVTSLLEKAATRNTS